MVKNSYNSKINIGSIKTLRKGFVTISPLSVFLSSQTLFQIFNKEVKQIFRKAWLLSHPRKPNGIPKEGCLNKFSESSVPTLTTLDLQKSSNACLLNSILRDCQTKIQSVHCGIRLTGLISQFPFGLYSQKQFPCSININ